MRRRDFLSTTLPFASGMVVFGHRYATAATTSRNILEFGAKPDGKTTNTKPIQRAIDAVSQAGGGTVVVPAGVFLTGLIELKSKVRLNLAEGSTLLGRTSMDDYKFESNSSGHDGTNPRHLIFAINADDVTISGDGRIDGQGPSFWEPSDKAPPPYDQPWAGVASHDLTPRKGGRPSPMLLFVNCRRLTIEDIHIHRRNRHHGMPERHDFKLLNRNRGRCDLPEEPEPFWTGTSPCEERRCDQLPPFHLL
jgi:polygalacturonase